MTVGPPTTPPGAVPTVAWRSAHPSGLPGALAMVDQTRLPHESVELVLDDVADVRAAIRRLSVRGAPAIGVAAAYGLVVGAQPGTGDDGDSFRRRLDAADHELRSSRPTAVNLAWALDRCRAAAAGLAPPQAVTAILAEARAIHAEDEAACRAMGMRCTGLMRDGGRYLTHCNTGRFATAGIGTAFSAFVCAQASGMDVEVFVGEVRPLLQGARLTMLELEERGIRGRLLPDSAAGALFAKGGLDGVFVGSDRIAANGDVANKIGTYGLAVLARAHGVPFWVVAPTSTIDGSLRDGTDIPIEQRDPDEVRTLRGALSAPAGCAVWNPAFDVTPATLVSGIVTEVALHRAPFASLAADRAAST